MSEIASAGRDRKIKRKEEGYNDTDSKWGPMISLQGVIKTY